VIFERTRRAECRHHGVARELLDGPAGALDFLRHRVVEAIEQSSADTARLEAQEPKKS
jgi:hypothetical protein